MFLSPFKLMWLYFDSPFEKIMCEEKSSKLRPHVKIRFPSKNFPKLKNTGTERERERELSTQTFALQNIQPSYVCCYAIKTLCI